MIWHVNWVEYMPIQDYTIKKYLKWCGHDLTCQSGRLDADSRFHQIKKYSEWFGHDLARQSGIIDADSGFYHLKNI
jgi:hypothetical protein